jgi:predicted nucleic acid-binding protein
VSRFVLDASVALRWFLSDPVPVYAAKVKRMLLEGHRAVVPVIWNLEMANALVDSSKRGMVSPGDLDDHLAVIERLLAGSIENQIEGISIRRAFAAARAFRLTAYDATYLDLAQSEKLPLSTLDNQLRKAAQRAGVEILR